MEKLASQKQKEINWYNEFYHDNIEKEFPSWYKLLLTDTLIKIKPELKVLELGCGTSVFLKYLYQNKILSADQIYGIDYSPEAIKILKNVIPSKHLIAGDLYEIDFSNNKFDMVFLMEVIEHLEQPDIVLDKVFKSLIVNGLFYLSFPNYNNIPWLAVRIFAEKTNHPNWINLQPIDKIYNYKIIKQMVLKHGFKFKYAIGSNYFPPILYKYENISLTKFLNRFGLSFLSLHPILVFEKSSK